jgi:topoisomerase-4 subunit B
MADLLENVKKEKPIIIHEYDASAIEVLEGLEPVRKRPGMYIGGTDVNALHHLISEVFDNSMDEVVAGYASKIDVKFMEGNKIVIMDDGRGIPIDNHPKFPDKSALEIILTTLHAGGKFGNKVYQTSGGLHGVGISVVNALTKELIVEAVRENILYRQVYSRGKPITKLEKIGEVKLKSGTIISFIPDEEIFKNNVNFNPAKIYNFIKSKAYLFKGVRVNWESYKEFDDVPKKEKIFFQNGIIDLLHDMSVDEPRLIENEFCGSESVDQFGKVEWGVAWPEFTNGEIKSFCNTVRTPLGGTHEAGFRLGLFKALQNFAEIHNRKNLHIIAEDVMTGSVIVLSLFISEPLFQGQTKEKLVSRDVTKKIEEIIKDKFEIFLTQNIKDAHLLLDYFANRALERLKRRRQQEVSRKSILTKLRLPGKLTDCLQSEAVGTEIFLVEGDSAGGSAKQARDRNFQAILPLKGKILNVASSSKDKIMANQEINDLNIALGCGNGTNYKAEQLRYEKVIIMTDADVDGAHIASLLMTYFYQEMPDLIREGHLYLAVPPLYRITAGKKTYYANNDLERDKIYAELEKKYKNIELGRFKGLGEMTPIQLKETTMDPDKRIMYKVMLNQDNEYDAAAKVNILMGRKAELRFKFIKEQNYLSAKDLENF